MEDILKSAARIRRIIVAELREVAAKYGRPRRTQLLFADDLPEEEAPEEESVPDYPCTLFYTAEGYFKKIQPNSLRMSSEQKLKEGDRIVQTVESSNARELLFFTDKATVYKARVSDFSDTKASVLGDYVPSKLGFEEGEQPFAMIVTGDYSGYLLFFYENGKVAKVEMSAYATKTNRRRLIGAYADKSPLVAVQWIGEDCEFMLESTAGRRLLVHTGAIAPKTTRSTIGVQVMTLKKPHTLKTVWKYEEGMSARPARYRTRTLPAAGALPAQEDIGEQLSFE